MVPADSRPPDSDGPRGPGPAVVASVHVYPVKGLAGVDLDVAEVTRRGVRHDRELMLVDPDGRLLSQREVPELALFRPAYDGAALRVTAPTGEVLAHDVRRDGEARAVWVHRDRCLGVDQGDAAATWFADLIGRPCRLVAFPKGATRGLDPRYAVGETMYADGYPLLLISRESLDDLNGRLGEPLPMNRFRPSIVVSGWGSPFTEDRVRRLRLGAVEVEVVKPCGRCVVTTVDQATGRRGHEPLRTLAAYRDIGGRLVFGQNAVPTVPGVIRVGDPVRVLSCASPR